MFRIGPIDLDRQTVYIVRGKRGAVTYHDSKVGGLCDMNIHSLTKPTTNNPKCLWNGDAPCYCDGRSCGRIQSVGEIWRTLEAEYKHL